VVDFLQLAKCFKSPSSSNEGTWKKGFVTFAYAPARETGKSIVFGDRNVEGGLYLALWKKKSE